MNHKIVLFSLVFLFVLGLAVGCDQLGRKSESPVGPTNQPSSSLAERLAKGLLPESEYQKLLLLSEEDRQELRKELVNYLSEGEIETRRDVFAVVGPAEGTEYPEALINEQAQKEIHGGPQKATAGWYLYVPVPFVSQIDGQWSGYPLGFNSCGNSTIGRYGCHLCCITMLYNKYGWNISPVTLNDWSCYGRAHYAFSTAACGDLIRVTEAMSYPNVCRRPWRYVAVDEIWGLLAKGFPVIAWTTQYGSHFVVIFGHDGLRYWVKDPAKSASQQDQWLTGAQQFRLYWYW